MIFNNNEERIYFFWSETTRDDIWIFESRLQHFIWRRSDLDRELEFLNWKSIRPTIFNNKTYNAK